MMVIFTMDIVPFEWQIPGWNWALIIPLSLVKLGVIYWSWTSYFFFFFVFFLVQRNVFIPFLRFISQIVLNSWLMIFSY